MLHSHFIASRVSALVKERDIRLRYCTEAGSRAWGLESTDSDYDVRFIYQHRREWYLQLNSTKDQVGPIMEHDGELDLAGWDIKKVLAHLAKSNPGVLEWLYSPVTYFVADDFLSAMRGLAETYFQPNRVVAHYLGIARSAKQAGYNEKDGTWNVKKYCYYMRPLLVAKHVLEHENMPSVAFADLLAEVGNVEVQNLAKALIERKAVAAEANRETIQPALDVYFADLQEKCSEGLDQLKRKEVDMTQINEFFRQIIGY